jgi:hypothetical protein
MTKFVLCVVTGVIALYGQNNFQPPGWVPNVSHASSLWQPDGQSGPVTGRPFSGTEIRHTTQVLADGTRVEHSDTSQFYRDAFGRMRSESPNRAQIYDPVAGVSYTLELAQKTYEKTTVKGGYSMAVVGSLIVSGGDHEDNPHSASDGRKVPAATNGQVLESQMVNGIFCRGTRVTTVIPAGTFGNDRDVKVTNERWYSDDLKVLVKSVNNDPRFGISTYELTNIVQGPPDPALFMPPTNFTNVQRHGSE